LFAQETLASLRAPGYVIPPFDRPVPKRFDYDDPDNPDHTPEVKADVEATGSSENEAGSGIEPNPYACEQSRIKPKNSDTVFQSLR